MTITDKPDSVAATLRAARALIEDPKRWTKGEYARPSKWSRTDVAPTDPRAGAWCALGALRAVDGKFERAAIAILIRTIDTSGYADGWSDHVIYEFNDVRHRRHADVLAAYDAAIAAAEKATVPA